MNEKPAYRGQDIPSAVIPFAISVIAVSLLVLATAKGLDLFTHIIAAPKSKGETRER